MSDSQRALIVEDRSDWQAILSKALDSLNWAYDIASTYDQALSLLEASYYDLAIIDPVLDNANRYNRDGLRVLAEINKRSPHTHLIVVSGSVTHASLREDPDIPRNLPLIEKHNWDYGIFKGLVLKASITPNDTIGRKTLVRMLRTALQEKPMTQDKLPAPPSPQERKGKPHVLIVEDRPDWQVILARSMEEEGWYWHSVLDASEALKLLKDSHTFFHVVLLDLRLGDAEVPLREGAGWQLLDFLANSNKRTRVIIVSGEASRGDVATLFMKYPIEGFIDKDTFKKNELLELIYTITDKPRIRVQTLGNFQIWRDKEAIDEFGSPEVEILLKILITLRGETAPESLLLEETLPNFPSADPRARKDALRAIIDTARYTLEPELASPGESAFILENEGGYALDMQKYITPDFEELERFYDEGKVYLQQGKHDTALEIFEHASTLYQGEYLPADRFAKWSVDLRAHLQTQIAKLLNRLADLYAERGQFDKAIETAQKCLVYSAYHESTHRRLMRYHTCKGDSHAALTVYATLEKLKREFFEEEPLPETKTLRDSIQAGEKVACIEQEET